MAERIERDVIANFEIGDARADLDDFAGRLVAEDDGQARDHALGAELPVEDVQVGAADAARADANEQCGLSRRRHRRVDNSAPGAGRVFAIAFICNASRVPSIRRRGGSRQRKHARRMFAEAGALLPVPQRSAAIAHPRANEAIIGVLLEACAIHPEARPMAKIAAGIDRGKPSIRTHTVR